MLIGVHGLVFTGVFDQKGLIRAIHGAQTAGYDLLELPLMDPKSFDSSLARTILDDSSLAVTASLGLQSNTDISSTDPRAVQAGRDVLMRCLDHVAEMGGSTLCGVIYSAMQKYNAPASPAGIANSQAVIADVAEAAAARNISVSLEVVNRYETNVMNTSRAGRRYLAEVDSRNVSLHLDTYHMNIEESDMWQPVVDAGSELGYVHIGESHRGYLGTGSVDFASFFRALHRNAYDGPVVFESFSSAVVSESLSNTLGIWRNLWEDSDHLAAHANRFIRDGLAAVSTIDLH
jgi:D-psicose/D-tagatose/L-ribulose 3-epimerase